MLSLNRLLRSVEDFFSAHLYDAIDAEQLDKTLGLAQAQIEEIQQGTGLDPVAYLKVLRLAQVHKALVVADPHRLSPADIARAWGFSNMRSFSREFAAFFKKSPSQVLRQPAAEYRKFVLSRVVH